VLKNSDADSKYTIPSSALLIPLDSTPSNLSSLVNHFLNEPDQIPFRFFIQGTLLQGPLQHLLKALNHPGEAQVLIEYTPAAKLPQEHREQICPDWIRCIKSRGSAALSGSFDSIIRLHSSTAILREYAGHRGCVTALEWVGEGQFVSGSGDWTLRWWDQETGASKAVLKGHGSGVQCVAYDPQSNVLASGDMDGQLAFWRLDESVIFEETEKPTKKKAKTVVKRLVHVGPQMKPLGMADAHKDGYVSALCMSESRLITSGLDHRLYLWDIEKRIKTYSLSLGNQVSAMACSNAQVLAVGSPDGHIKLFDSRTLRATCGSTKLHEGWINAVAWSPLDENHFCTTGADLRVCVWDRRGLDLGPLNVLSGQSRAGANKMLGLDWSSAGLFYGGEDCKLHSWT